MTGRAGRLAYLRSVSLTDEAAARSLARRLGRVVVYGEGWYLVATPDDALALMRGGYEAMPCE